MMPSFEILPWDSDFFAMKVAKVNVQSEKVEDWQNIIVALKKENVKLAYWQIQPGNKSFIQFAAQNNGFIADLKTTYRIENIQISDFTPFDLYTNNIASEQLIKLGIQCGLYSRYALDKNIPREKMEELYSLWIINSVNKKMADDIIIQYVNSNIAGLITVYVKDGIGNIGLIGVDEKHRGQGIGKKLIDATKQYFVNKKITTIEVVTQGENKAACRLYESAGFKQKSQTEFYHFWL